MKIYETVKSERNVFELKKEESKQFLLDFENPNEDMPIIKHKNHYLRLVKKDEFLCEGCFLHKDKCYGNCIISEILKNKEDWNYYIFKEIEQYEIIFGENKNEDI